MITSWMAYAILVSLLLTLSATALDHVAGGRRWPRRFVWAVTLIASVAWPVGSVIRQLQPVPAAPVRLLPFVITVSPTQIISPGSARPSWVGQMDRGLLVLWCVASALLLLRLAQGMFALRRDRAAWRRDVVGGTSVRMSSNVGPAVVGLLSMEVVLPEWIVSLDRHLLAMVLCHEEEHRRARDPYLLLGAAVAVALMPWNLALWMQAKRLRLAIEMDCDARVLRAHPSPERYGLLMLTIAQRKSVAPALFAPMLTDPTTQLERRIVAMETSTRRLARVTAYAATTLAMGVIAFACSLQSDGPATPKSSAARGPVAMNSGQTYFDFQVEKQAVPMAGNRPVRYPDMLRNANVEGSVLAQFVIDTAGRPDMGSFKVLKSSHDLFTNSVKAALPAMLFEAGEVGGKKVRQLVQMPFEFSLKPQVVTADMEKRGFFDFQVEKQASPIPNNVAPRYPDSLRTANVEGEVLARFTIGEDGRADMTSFKVTKATHPLFVDAVRKSLPNMKFNPALVGGRPVRQNIEMPFTFSLSKD